MYVFSDFHVEETVQFFVTLIDFRLLEFLQKMKIASIFNIEPNLAGREADQLHTVLRFKCMEPFLHWHIFVNKVVNMNGGESFG
jgi:hypothetical protein